MQEEFAAAELCDFIREKFQATILKPMSRAAGPRVGVTELEGTSEKRRS
jgi:hypothetical protein